VFAADCSLNGSDFPNDASHMSLWNKAVSDITFADVEAFCRQRHREEPRLDYNREWGKDHHKLICAFANTLGGIIMLAVDGDENSDLWQSLASFRQAERQTGYRQANWLAKARCSSHNSA
jgi:hypothetical protein